MKGGFYALTTKTKTIAANADRYSQPKLRAYYRKSLCFLNEKIYFFHNKRPPSEMGSSEVGNFLTYLAVEKNVSPATQNQALCALNFV